jgi:hypothetical protein
MAELTRKSLRDRYVVEPCTDTLLQRAGREFDCDIIRGPWICGGLVRRVVCVDDLGDTDMDIAFGRHSMPIDKKYNPEIKPHGAHQAHVMGYIMPVTMFTISDDLGAVYHAYQLIDSFTLTACQFASDGRVNVYTALGYEDAVNRIGRIVVDQPYAGKKLIAKYRDKHGFTLTPETEHWLNHGIESAQVDSD